MLAVCLGHRPLYRTVPNHDEQTVGLTQGQLNKLLRISIASPPSDKGLKESLQAPSITSTFGYDRLFRPSSKYDRFALKSRRTSWEGPLSP